MKKNNYLCLFGSYRVHNKLLLIMKLSFIINLLLLSSISANSFSQKSNFSFSLNNVMVKDVIKTIEANSDYRFFYNDELSDVTKLVTVNFKDASLSNILNELFDNTGIVYKVLEDNLIVIAPETTLQQVKVSGKVTDSTTGEPLPGVSILVEGTTLGVATDMGGNFSIDLPSANSVLIFSYIGYNSEKVSVDGKSTLNVSLIPDVKSLDEVVVIGYGTVKKSDLTGAVATVSESTLRSSIVTNIDQALQGRIAGIQVTQNSGQPGGGTSIRIRGANSVTGSNEPLYVIDGIPFQGDGGTVNGFSWAGGSNGQSKVNPLATINPNDIVRMEVLKDASATAIYGARAANGVILITTKHGVSGKTKVSYNGYYAIQELPKKLDMMNMQEFAAYRVDADREVGNTPNQRYLDPSILGEGTDWQDEVFRTAAMQNHQISITGGSEKSTFAITGSYFKQDGIVINSGFDRYTTRINLDQKVNDWIKVGQNLSFSKVSEVITLNDGTDGVIQNALKMGPDIPVKDMDGNYGGPDSNVGGISYNPVGAALLRNNKSWRQRIMGNFYADLTFLKHFTFRSEIGIDNNHSLDKAFTPTFQWGALKGWPNQLRQQETNSFFWIWKNYLNYNATFGNHTVGAMIGQEAQKSEWEGAWITKKEFATNDIPVLSEGNDYNPATGNYTTTDGWKDASSILSYFGRANYSFKEKYLLTVTVRADGSSKFGANNRWGYFPSGSFAWRVTKEGFMPQSNVLSDLKFRFGYGEVGNQAIANYLFGSAMQSFPSAFGTAYKNAKIANPDLKWEASRQVNLGMDLSLFSGRVTFDVNFYKKYTKDLLLQLTVPSYLGGTGDQDIAAPFANIGKLENKGFEITLSSTNINGKFNWNSDFTFTLNRNMVKELESEGATQWGRLDWYTEFQQATMTRAGYPIGVFYGYVTDGLFQNQEDILNHAVQVMEANTIDAEHPNGINLVNRRDGVWIGDIKFKDLDGNGVINTDDRQVIGDPNPDFTCGLNNNFSYGPFDMSVYLTASYGGDVLNYQKVELSGMTSIYANQLSIVNDRARYQLIDPAGSDTDPANVVLANPDATIPRYATTDNNRNNRMSDRFIEDGSYLRIQTVSLGYTLPSALTKKIKMEKLKLYINVNNLYTFTNYSGYDPEIGSFDQNARLQNVDMGRYPAPRVITFGIDVDF